MKLPGLGLVSISIRDVGHAASLQVSYDQIQAVLILHTAGFVFRSRNWADSAVLSRETALDAYSKVETFQERHRRGVTLEVQDWQCASARA